MKKKHINGALWLTRFEIRHSLLSYALLAIVFSILFLFLSPSYRIVKDDIGMGMDYNFLFVFLILATLVKPRPFKSVSVGNFIYVSPFHLLVRQLPIQRTTYIMYHLIYRFLLSTVFTSVYLIFLYPFWDRTIPFTHYISFILLWIALSYTIHLLDAYSHFGYNLIIWLSVIIIITPILFIILLLIFHIYFYRAGFVHWTLDMAIQSPILTTMAAILIVIANIVFWSYMFRRKLNKIDLFY